MKYLEYFENGFLKKIPLEKEETIIGRDSECDFQIDNNTISRRHIKITKNLDHIYVKDLNSKNGLFYKNKRVKEATVHINESFRIAGIVFYLRDGKDENVKLHYNSTKNSSKNVNETVLLDTIKVFSFFDKNIHQFFYLKLNGYDFADLLSFVRKDVWDRLLQKGDMLILIGNSIKDSETIFKMGANTLHPYDSRDFPDEIFSEETFNEKLHSDYFFYSTPLKIKNEKAVFVFIYSKNNKLDKKTLRMLKDFVKEISVVYNIFKKSKKESELNIITKSENFFRILSQAKTIAKENINILIEGETGVGKELVAKYIYSNSPQKKGRYIGINCSAIPENLLEDELFGHEKGAFTGAHKQRQGKLELASGGILVLDEIADMPLNLQAKLLRVLQEKKFYRLGGNKPIHVSLRIIAITNKNIEELIEEGKFREDLYFRIAHYTIKIPPLRERPEDIEILTNYFLKKFSSERKKQIFITLKALEFLKKHKWRGNVRELENTIQSLVGFSGDKDIIDLNKITTIFPKFQFLQDRESGKNPLNDEKDLILETLKENKWNKTLVAKKLGISRTTLYEKMKKFKIE